MLPLLGTISFHVISFQFTPIASCTCILGHACLKPPLLKPCFLFLPQKKSPLVWHDRCVFSVLVDIYWLECALVQVPT
ncbi:hypothetical protein V8C37DRAFT_392377 [Trichoderma ceciliae]